MQGASLKYFFRALFFFVILSIVAVGVNAAGSGQHKVLSPGDPPLTSQMMSRLIDVFEWSLDIKFTDEDRTALQQVVVNYWQTNDVKSIQSIRETLSFDQRVQSWSDEQKRATQPQIKEKLLEHLAQNQSDEMSMLLLAISQRRGENGSHVMASELNTEAAGMTQLAGKWQVLHGNSIVGVDINSGRIGDGNAMIAEFDIRPDGRVLYSFVLQQSNYGCTTRLKTSKTGRVLVSGSQITFAYDGGTTTSEDGCQAKYNYTKKLSPERETFDFDLQRKNGKVNLCLANQKIKDCAVKVR